MAKTGNSILLRLGFRKDAQDLIEYALTAGFVAGSAGAILPDVASTNGTIFSQDLRGHVNAASQFGSTGSSKGGSSPDVLGPSQGVSWSGVFLSLSERSL